MNLLFNKINKKIFINNLESFDESFFEGICLNSDDNSKEMFSRYQKIGYRVIRFYKGMYFFACFNKQNNELFITNDWLSKKPLYYFDNEKYFLCSTSFFSLIKEIKTIGITMHPSKSAFCSILNYGSVDLDLTYVDEIKYVKRFQFLLCKNGLLEVCNYYPEKKTNNLSFRDSISKFDAFFSQAVRIQCDYNQKNGFDQVFTISAGMDSRSVLLKSIKLGYKPSLCISYSQSKSIDEIISKKICSDLKIPLYYITLDDGRCLKNIEQPILNNEGMQVYCGSTGATLLNEIPSFAKSKQQIVHVGLLGGELMSYEDDDLRNSNYYHNVFGIDDIVAMSKNVSHRTLFIESNTRCCQNLIRQFSNLAYAFSPFLDEDLYEYLLFVNPKFMYRRKMYFKWMRKYIPNNYLTTYNKSRIFDPKIVVFFKRLFVHFEKKCKGTTKFDMNPFDLWSDKPEIRDFLFNSFAELSKYNPGFISNEKLVEHFEQTRSFKKAAIITYLFTMKLIDEM